MITLFLHRLNFLFVSAPEVLATTPYGHTADWWSLGILMYVMLAGRVSIVKVILGLEWLTINTMLRLHTIRGGNSVLHIRIICEKIRMPVYQIIIFSL